jgi:hypothetical protein
MNKIQLTYSRPTFLTAASKSSLADTSWAGSETVPRGCPRDSLVFNQSRAHWRAKLLNQKEIIRQKMGRIDLKQFHSKQNVLFKRVSAFFRYIQKRQLKFPDLTGKVSLFSLVLCEQSIVLDIQVAIWHEWEKASLFSLWLCEQSIVLDNSGSYLAWARKGTLTYAFDQNIEHALLPRQNL